VLRTLKSRNRSGDTKVVVAYHLRPLASCDRGMHSAAGSRDIEGTGEAFTGESEATYMHDAVMALMFMVIVMFPCFLSSVTPE